MLKFLIVTFLVLYLLYSFSGKIMQWLAKILIRRMEKQMQNQFETTKYTKEEGGITIQKVAKKPSKRSTDAFGDYVEFEEIK